MKSEIETKILDILFKDKVIAESITDLLLPEIIINSEMREDISLEFMVTICRDTVRTNIQKMIKGA